jgi:hypothetical protein
MIRTKNFLGWTSYIGAIAPMKQTAALQGNDGMMLCAQSKYMCNSTVKYARGFVYVPKAECDRFLERYN